MGCSTLPLSPAHSGERAEAGPPCPAEGEGQPLVRTPLFGLSKIAVATIAPVAAPHPDPLPLCAKSAKGRGNGRVRWGFGPNPRKTPEIGSADAAVIGEVL